MLARLTISQKLALISVTLSALLIALAVSMLFELKDTMIDGRKVKLRGLVESAVNVVNTYAKMEQDGVLSREEAQKRAIDAVYGMNFDGKNYFFIAQTDGVLVAHPTRQEQIGKNLLESTDEGTRRNYTMFLGAARDSAFLEGFAESLGRRPGSKEMNAPKLFLSAKDKAWNWVVTTGIFIDDINALFWERAFLLLGVAAAGLCVGGGLAYAVGRSITKPLNLMVTALEKLGDGDRDVTVPVDRADTEIGRMTRTFDQFREKLRETDALRARQAAVEKQAEEERRAAILGFADEFERSVAAAVASLTDEVERVAEASAELSQSASLSAAGTGRVNETAQSSAANIQTVASAATELHSSIDEIQRQVHTVRDAVEKTRERSSGTQGQITALAESVERIGSVVELINSIANQTNLLALNATIEAARAGDAGKGFAVVASEVKDLATQTTKATDDIRRQIDLLTAATDESVNGVKDIGNVVEHLFETTAAITIAIEEQTAATSEITRNTDLTSDETQSIAEAIADVAQSVGATEATAKTMSAATATMRARAEAVGREARSFLERIRAA